MPVMRYSSALVDLLSLIKVVRLSNDIQALSSGILQEKNLPQRGKERLDGFIHQLSRLDLAQHDKPPPKCL